MKKDLKQKIEKAIKDLKLNEEDVNTITYGNMNKICDMVKCDMLDLMYYLRYERD